MSDGRCAISWHGVPCRYGCNDPKPPSPSREIAEKIIEVVGRYNLDEYDEDKPEVIAKIESLIDVALAEENAETIKAYQTGLRRGEKEARSAAIEEASKIASSHTHVNSPFGCNCELRIAEAIQKIKENL